MYWPSKVYEGILLRLFGHILCCRYQFPWSGGSQKVVAMGYNLPWSLSISGARWFIRRLNGIFSSDLTVARNKGDTYVQYDPYWEADWAEWLLYLIPMYRSSTSSSTMPWWKLFLAKKAKCLPVSSTAMSTASSRQARGEGHVWRSSLRSGPPHPPSWVTVLNLFQRPNWWHFERWFHESLRS